MSQTVGQCRQSAVVPHLTCLCTKQKLPHFTRVDSTSKRFLELQICFEAASAQCRQITATADALGDKQKLHCQGVHLGIPQLYSLPAPVPLHLRQVVRRSLLPNCFWNGARIAIRDTKHPQPNTNKANSSQLRRYHTLQPFHDKVCAAADASGLETPAKRDNTPFVHRYPHALQRHENPSIVSMARIQPTVTFSPVHLISAQTSCSSVR